MRPSTEIWSLSGRCNAPRRWRSHRGPVGQHVARYSGRRQVWSWPENGQFLCFSCVPILLDVMMRSWGFWLLTFRNYISHSFSRVRWSIKMKQTAVCWFEMSGTIDCAAHGAWTGSQPRRSGESSTLVRSFVCVCVCVCESVCTSATLALTPKLSHFSVLICFWFI